MILRREQKIDSINSLLESSEYIEYQKEPISIPLIDYSVNEDCNIKLVNYDDISSLEEEYSLDPISAIEIIAESNDIDPNDIFVTIEESEIYKDINCTNYYPNYLLYQVPENSIEAIVTNNILEEYENTLDDNLLDIIADDYLFMQEAMNIPGMGENAKESEQRRKEMEADIYATFGPKNVEKHTTSSNSITTTSNKPKPIPKKEQKNNEPAEEPQKKEGMFSTVKRYVLNNKKKVGASAAAGLIGGAMALRKNPSVARRIALIKNKILGYQNRMKSEPQKSGLFSRIIAKLKALLAKLTGSK